jgi:hypothetical protein
MVEIEALILDLFPRWVNQEAAETLSIENKPAPLLGLSIDTFRSFFESKDWSFL